MSDIQIEVDGLDRIEKAFDKFPKQIERNMSQAGDESVKRVFFKTRGILPYPAATDANRPPTPYYIRGRGTQYKGGNKGNSERLGTKWTTKRLPYGVELGNSASYAKWVHGEQQARAMERIGWKKLADVGKEKIKDIQKVFQAWVDKTIKDLGL